MTGQSLLRPQNQKESQAISTLFSITNYHLLLHRLSQTFELAARGTIYDAVADADDQTAQDVRVNAEVDARHAGETPLHIRLLIIRERQSRGDFSRRTRYGDTFEHGNFAGFDSAEKFFNE